METLGESIIGEKEEPLCAGAGEGQLDVCWASVQQRKLMAQGPGSCLAQSRKHLSVLCLPCVSLRKHFQCGQ